MHVLIEYIPLVVFLLFYKFADLYWATGSLIITSALQILYYFLKKDKIPTRNWIFFALILVFGSLTIFFHDDAFIKWKVTIINGFFAMSLLISKHFFNKNIIKQFLSESLSLPETIWTKLNFAWAMFFALCGALNLYIAFNFDLDTWVNFKVFGLTGLTLTFAIGSVFSLHRYLPQDEKVVETRQDNIEISANVMSESPVDKK
ncbi:MAG: septation protein A [Litorilituus sp.]|jgi:intracellular septation protein|nr:septation protein A [Litorilituus sp.]